jgi:hypothetical protein
MNIEVTSVDLVEFAKAVYDLSSPQGMGFMHARQGPLSTYDARECLRDEGRCVLDMDYVHGRACKMHVFREGEKLFIRAPWYDHTDAQLRELLARFGLDISSGAEKHLPTCNCVECR